MDRSPEGLKKRLINCSHDPSLFQDLRNVMMHRFMYTEETRDELMQIARSQRQLFTLKQWKHIQNNFHEQLKRNTVNDYDDDFVPNEAPEGISDYDYETYFCE